MTDSGLIPAVLSEKSLRRFVAGRADNCPCAAEIFLAKGFVSPAKAFSRRNTSLSSPAKGFGRRFCRDVSGFMWARNGFYVGKKWVLCERERVLFWRRVVWLFERDLPDSSDLSDTSGLSEGGQKPVRLRTKRTDSGKFLGLSHKILRACLDIYMIFCYLCLCMCA